MPAGRIASLGATPGFHHGLLAVLALALVGAVAGGALPPALGTPQHDVQFVFTSDAHYGITRPTFRGAAVVDAHIVNEALVAQINTLSRLKFPNDGGLKAREPVGAVDFLAEGGDVANRSEVSGTVAIQPAAVSWSQFRADYIDGLTLAGRAGAKAAMYVVPGNHDASNAVGFYRPMRPATDSTPMVEIYNLMMAPAVRKTTATYDYAKDKVLTSRDIGGVHFVFLTVWPDSVGRAWLERDLRRISATTPVIVFTHDQPDAESKHFINPNGRHYINATDKFENVLADTLADGSTTSTDDIVEQEAWESFVKRHPNVQAYFHGNSNWNECYDWTGPHHQVALHTFRVDSPMKGKLSEKDETKLSFQIATIDTATRKMTVREVLWNPDPKHPSAPIVWGASSTVSLATRL